MDERYYGQRDRDPVSQRRLNCHEASSDGVDGDASEDPEYGKHEDEVLGPEVEPRGGREQRSPEQERDEAAAGASLGVPEERGEPEARERGDEI